MDWLRKLPGYQRSAPGLEWRILRIMPTVFFFFFVLPALMAFAGRYFITAKTAEALAREIQKLDYMMLGLGLYIWSLSILVTMGCVIVWMMKGPTYVADGYDVSHSDKPKV